MTNEQSHPVNTTPWAGTWMTVASTLCRCSTRPGCWPVVGGGLEAAAFGWVLSRQLRHGDRGRALGAYVLFTSLALAVLIVDALRL